MKKRIVAMVLAGTMVFSQNVYATELSDGTGQTMTEQTETEQQDTNAVEKEYAQSEQQNSEMLDDDEIKMLITAQMRMKKIVIGKKYSSMPVMTMIQVYLMRNYTNQI